jgi:hypothetical protein
VKSVKSGEKSLEAEIQNSLSQLQTESLQQLPQAASTLPVIRQTLNRTAVSSRKAKRILRKE